MARHDSRDDGQSYAGAGKLLGTMQALKNAEELVRIAHVETRAIVCHFVDGFAALYAATDRDRWLGPFGAVFQGIADEIAPHLADDRRVA